ncbi:endonuclease V [bacterium]|nr:endonuclease V [candidate division CSSED10-310 bacterium]
MSRIFPPHSWPSGYHEALRIQEDLVQRLRFEPLTGPVETIGGVDISYSKKSRRMYAAVLVFDYARMQVIDEGTWIQDETFPYIPGMLTFREGPAATRAMEKISIRPDVMLFDGHGIAHPRFCGTASHLGLIWGIPSIGVAKKKLVGEYTEPDPEAGSATELIYKDRVVGRVLRTRTNVKPVFVSQGNRIDLDSAVRVVLACCSRHRLPEPTRRAHLRVNELRRKAEG